LAQAHPRKYPRISARVPVDYSVGEKSSRCHAITVGGGGLFLTGMEELELGKELAVRLRPAKHLPVIEAKAAVRYQVSGQGAGIEFTEISAAARHTLLRIIHQRTGDRRINPRAPLATQVDCEECRALAFSRDVSLAGMFIEIDPPPPVGTRLKVRFNLNEKDKLVTAVVNVAYHVAKMGMGVLFAELTPQDQLAIEEYVLTMMNPPPTPPGPTRLPS
jgi:PilZ domain